MVGSTTTAVLAKIARRTAYGLGGLTLSGTAAVAVYTSTEQGLGLRREMRFWSEVAPVVFDYWWNSSSSSPKIKFQSFQNNRATSNGNRSNNGTTQTVKCDSEQIEKVDTTLESEHNNNTSNDKKKKADVYNELHERNAPRIFNTMLELGGLYIKLGQVLSVTALPVPNQYRELFRTLQSSVPGHEEFEQVIKPTLERELGPLDEIFEYIEAVPCGAASIGQAHRAKLKKQDSNTDDTEGDDSRNVIIKVQYPDAKWQVPADVQCVGDFLQLCVYFGLVDESSAKLSYNEFSRQFLAELDYHQERDNLHEVYESSLNQDAPYIRRGVQIPKVFPELCTKQVITMTYLPGPKFEEEARRQLKSLGINTDLGMRAVVQEAVQDVTAEGEPKNLSASTSTDIPHKVQPSPWTLRVAETAGRVIGMDNILFMTRLARKIMLWSTAAAVGSIQAASRLSLVPTAWLEWARDHKNIASQIKMLEWTNDAIDALFDVHGYQIFNQGLFNADSHPGNILVVQDEDTKNKSPQLGLIDYGQCKRLNPEEREKVAKLIVSVANNESDEVIATHFRDLGIKTKNNSTKFLGEFARLMFGPFQPKHLKHEYHQSLHKEDRVTYFPNELSMVYRTALLLRGLAMSFQINVSVGEKWREHAHRAIQQQ